MAEAGLTFVKPREVADDEVDTGGDTEADPVVRQGVGGPFGAEAHEVDRHHERVENDGVEDEEHPEAATPEGEEAR